MGAGVSSPCMPSGADHASDAKRLDAILLCGVSEREDASSDEWESISSELEFGNLHDMAQAEGSPATQWPRSPQSPRPVGQPLLLPAATSHASPPALGSRAGAPAPKEQESDLLERFPKGANTCDAEQNSVRLVSLGCYCGPKLSFQKMGRGAETLPFDWIRTRIEGVFDFLRNDFQGFYDFVTHESVPNSGGMVAFRGPLHSFWHDDPREASMRERYDRRIRRFGEIDARSGLVLFVRVAGHTGELARAPELLAELKRQFGQGARLLLVLNFQRAGLGAAEVRGLEHLMVYLLPSDAHTRDSEHFNSPYVVPVRCALDWVLGRPAPVSGYDSLEALSKVVCPDQWGRSGLGGLPAFEDVPGVV